MAKRGRPPIKVKQEFMPIVDLDGFEVAKASSTHDESSSGFAAPRRRNKVATSKRADEYTHIKNAINPFGTGNGTVDIQEAVELCQKACWCFPLLRNVIEIMTELSNSRIYLTEGSERANNFIGGWFNKINLYKTKDQFYREYYRSGNVFFYRFDTEIPTEDITNQSTVYGAAKSSVVLPVRYVLLNPSLIRMETNINFDSPDYLKVLTDYEVSRLKNPQTKSEKLFSDSLPTEVKTKILNGYENMMLLESKYLHTIFYKKQDYEPFAIPMAFPVLKDINWKLELKNIDAAIARTTDWAILLLTMGDEKEGVTEKQLDRLRSLMENESVKRTLVSDHTTKGQWLIPDIAAILGGAKYEQVDKDIREGLNSIFFSDGEKFANTHVKIKMFLERLNDAQQAFCKFLQDEVDRVCDAMSFKMYPKVNFEYIDLDDPIQYAKIYTRLMELGIMTPDEGMEAIDIGKLPSPQDAVIAQEKYKKLRDKGYYEPLIGGKKDPAEGRPGGTKGSPKSSKKVSPIGASLSISSVKDIICKASELEDTVLLALRRKFNTKKLSGKQKDVAKLLCSAIMVNEDNWIESVGKYLESPMEPNADKMREIDSLASEYGVSHDDAMILLLSRGDDKEAA
jgi:hypothetical protein